MNSTHQLFDLSNDPNEIQDLASSPGHRTIIDRLTVALRQSQQSYGDTQVLSVASPRLKGIDFSDRQRVPDRWQPPWIVQKYLQP